ncbi:MAG: helix-turn-helix transcriptional regulator [Alphaproteobacteria bacterium]|nr:helix-turn-helix transcriptional regulator [Alphaproteobacteria bacterium]
MLQHATLWNAIDRLAEKHGLSASGLAKKAGLSATLFNPSKRTGHKRNHWPSTESIAAILRATGTSLDDFIALTELQKRPSTKIPFLALSEARQKGFFSMEDGSPEIAKWDEIPIPSSQDPRAFALEITGRSLEPVYRDGTIVILAPEERPRRGDRVGVLTRKGEILIRKLGREGAQKIELSPFNPDRPPETLAREDIFWLYRVTWASQ